MLPDNVIRYMQSEDWYTERENKEEAISIMTGLGIDPSSEIGRFYRNTYGDLISPKPVAQLLEMNQFEDQTRYVRERYELPKELIPITSDESEGMYLYNIKDQ